jgi:hypothetical protein
LKKVKMNNSTQGSPDGMRVLNYQGGYEYDLPDRLAKSFVEMGAANYVTVRERKSIQAAPENAAMNRAPQNAETATEEAPHIRAYQLAEELDLSSKEIISIAKKIGIFVRVPASGISKDEVRRIKNSLKKSRRRKG